MAREMLAMQCSVYVATSLDGFIAREDGSIDWLSSVERAGEDYGYQLFYDTVDTIIVGRKTYETALGFGAWPYAGKRCVVLTKQVLRPVHNEEFHSGPAALLVARLASEGARRAYVDGGSVVQQFLSLGLINDLTLSIIPVLLGQGSRLFGETTADLPLQLSSSRAFASGLVQLEYRLAQAAAGIP